MTIDCYFPLPVKYYSKQLLSTVHFTDCTPLQPCQGLGPHAHFRDFGTAMLTLFRIATGDNWNGILEVRK